ncbi:glycoside hydrolase [Photorhabdus luminescens]|uniref:glycoside hydrolase n=1 Tax=Photorhabdus luminescens TaxID=29488 RepID=UPI00223EBF3C|nr:glycoside hydrolase [Photorhabdus luminescens]MCW7760354.1 glycoside hydrolase [Photorhabdus luminescens subsp. venezuelensis]
MRLIPVCFLIITPLAHALTLSNTHWQIEIDPQTLSTRAILPSGQVFPLSLAQPSKHVVQLEQDDSNINAQWQWNGDTYVNARLHGDTLIMSFKRTATGQLQWPVLPSGAKTLLLPLHEGYAIPAQDKDWRQVLPNEYSGINTTEDLSLPVAGFDYGSHVISVLFANPFNNALTFTPDDNGIGMTTTHQFTRLDPTQPYEVQIALNDADWLSPAKQYRKWLQARGEFVPLKSKLAAAKDGNRLIGASHVYLWGERLIVPQDVKEWRVLQKLIPASWLKGEAAKAARDANLARNTYLQRVLIDSINDTLIQMAPGEDITQFEKRREIVSNTLGRALNPPETWGDSNSPKMIDLLQKAGLGKLWLGLPQWTAGFASPAGINAAKKAGYLIGPYDSYDTALPDDNINPSWLSAQLGQAAFLRCGIMLENGKRKAGFQGEGVYTNPTCVRPLMEQRIPHIQAINHYNSWFLDVDGTGMVFDDYDPSKPTSQAQDAKNRIEGMAWIAQSQGVVVGSEVGGAVSNASVTFAHGMQTTGFGWHDVDMRKKQNSPYFLGKWYPDYQPAFFFKTSSIKPHYQKLYFNPRTRLPLFQAAFHDSVVTTHHWTIDSLKFKETRVVTELMQQLYNVPPLLNLSLDTAGKRINYLKSLDAFFRPLHQKLYDQALTGFRWLNADGSVQETLFADGTRIIANFSQQPVSLENREIAAFSTLAVLPDGKTVRFQSAQMLK